MDTLLFKFFDFHKKTMRNAKKNFVRIIILPIVVLICCPNSLASEQTNTMLQPNQQNSWQVELTPYLWLAGLNGEIKIGRLPTETADASPSSLLKALDFGLMGMLEIRKGNYGILLDAMYINLSKDESSKLFDEVSLKATQQLYEFAGMYRPFESESASLDLLAGARYFNIDSDISVDARNPRSVLLANRNVNAGAGWLDGFIGARGLYSLTDNWKLVGYADIGTGGSQISWQALAGVNYVFSKHVIGKVGYRILSEDYDKGKLYYNMRMGGFYLGLGIRF